MSDFLKRVDAGRLGLNEGLPNGLKTLNRYIYGTQKSRYYLLGGESGTGKTTLADFMFLFEPYRYLKLTPNVKVRWKYYSFEQGRRAKEDSWASKILYDSYQKRLPVSYILSKGSNRVSEEDYQLCMKVAGQIDGMFEYIDMVDVAITPSQFKNDMFRYGSEHGTWHTRPLLDSSGNPRINPKTEKKIMEVYGWTPKDPEENHIIIMDHIAYAALEFATLKQNIDTISRSIVFFREITTWTFVVIQQFNTDLASIERQKFKKNAIAPQRVDFGDSKYTYQDADVVFGMLNPYAYDIMEFQDYKIDRLRGYAIWAFLMKNRHDGPANRAVPLFMDPVAGTFTELPEPTSAAFVDMGGEDAVEPFYDKADEFNETIKLYSLI